jgi:tRNA threonylcarbamoyladenosine biosynthesis protein TsaB
MLLLATDTSSRHGSIALARCGPGDLCDVISVVPLDGGTFSAQLVPQIAVLLAKHNFGKQDIGAFAVVTGPGSFTGLRIGLAAVKALAEVLAKPIAAISMLQAIAVSGGLQGNVIAVLDAGRGEIYVGDYHVNGSEALLQNERLLTREDLAQAVPGSIVVTPDHGLAELARAAGLQVSEIEVPRSDVVARLGWQKIQAGETVSPEDLDANYVRRSGEIFSKISS